MISLNLCSVTEVSGPYSRLIIIKVIGARLGFPLYSSSTMVRPESCTLLISDFDVSQARISRPYIVDLVELYVEPLSPSLPLYFNEYDKVSMENLLRFMAALRRLFRSLYLPEAIRLCS